MYLTHFFVMYSPAEVEVCRNLDNPGSMILQQLDFDLQLCTLLVLVEPNKKQALCCR